MTNLQVAYQQLQETKRANEAREAIQKQQADTQSFEARLKELKLPYETRKLLEDANLSVAQQNKLTQEIANLQSELELIQARTDLTLEQKEVEKEKAIAARRQNWKEGTGYTYVENLINSITGGLGKAVSSLFK